MTDVGHVTRLEMGDKEIYLIGTAHVSPKSVTEVERVIRELRPDTVCVELDEHRHRMLVDRDAWKKLDVFQVIREQRVLFLLSSLALGAYQRKMAAKLGVPPGAELLMALRTAEEVGAHVVLADREIQATLKRTWHNLSLWDKLQVTVGLLAVPFARGGELDEASIEKLKDRDTVGELLKQVAAEMPRLKGPLIDERDAFLISAISEAPGRRIVGVVGAAHVDGMVQRVGQTVDRAALSTLPTTSQATNLWRWWVPVVVSIAFFLQSWVHRMQGFEDLLFAWVVPNALSSAALTTLSLAHPLTILVAALTGPWTALAPRRRAGVVVGYVEAWLRKPTVDDCATVGTAMNNIGSLYSNRVLRVLLVSLSATWGSALGAWIGAIWVLTRALR